MRRLLRCPWTYWIVTLSNRVERLLRIASRSPRFDLPGKEATLT